MAPTSVFPGATAVSHLRVYDWPAADGRMGGSPHLHVASTEGYVVLGGVGTLETLSSEGYAETPLVRGTVLWFTPGTVHRAVNVDGHLEVLAVMQNAGLPESGDAVLTFPSAVLADPDAYAEAQALPPVGADETAADVDSPAARAARQRRDLAVEGYLELKKRVIADGPGVLADLYEAAAALLQPRAEHWRTLWEQRALDQANQTGQHLDDLASGKAPHLADARVHHAERRDGPRRFGMCGRLRVWNFDGTN